MVIVSYKNLKRYKEIGLVLVKYGFTFIVEKLNMESVAYKIPITNPPEEIKNMSTGEKIRSVIEELGPTYVKLGQILSTRKDLLDPEIIEEISKLRDNVEPFNTDEAKEIFKKEVGLSVEQIFEEFKDTPMAAASIGQVYEAKLKHGEEVIIKIQRPNIEQTINSDIEILKSMIVSINDLSKDKKRNIDIDLIKIVEEFHTQLIRELDYNFEAINAMKFRKMFEESKEVYIPKIYSEYTTKRVLVMEKIIGIKLSDVEAINDLGWDTENISQIGVRSLFKQVLDYGFFHADPHPGNIFVVSRDCISYIDFGMIGIVDNKTLNFLNGIAIAIAQKNVDKIIYLLTEMDVLNPNIDNNALRQDLLYLIHYYYDVPIDKINVSDILNEVFRFLRKYKVCIPTQLATLAKTVITLEGTGRQLNPNFSIKTAGEEFIKHYYKNKLDPKNILLNSKDNVEEVLLDLKTIPKQLKVILKNLEKNNIKIQIEDLKFTTLEKCIGDLATQLSLSLVLASMVVGSSLIIASPNINDNIWISLMAGAGFFISFIIGILLVIKIFRSQYKNRG
ncbi:ABC1 kinase family protein [Romboutsia sp.]|uniref:ABC1 kinase family protein n=1 Tax=Romboutsia sp. TaxID=1965302 RepID=UPI003F3F9779